MSCMFLQEHCKTCEIEGAGDLQAMVQAPTATTDDAGHILVETNPISGIAVEQVHSLQGRWLCLFVSLLRLHAQSPCLTCCFKRSCIATPVCIVHHSLFEDDTAERQATNDGHVRWLACCSRQKGYRVT